MRHGIFFVLLLLLLLIFNRRSEFFCRHSDVRLRRSNPCIFLSYLRITCIVEVRVTNELESRTSGTASRDGLVLRVMVRTCSSFECWIGKWSRICSTQVDISFIALSLRDRRTVRGASSFVRFHPSVHVDDAGKTCNENTMRMNVGARERDSPSLPDCERIRGSSPLFSTA